MQTKEMTILKYILASGWAWLMSFIVPIAHFLVFTIVLVVTDLVTGVQAARKRGEELRSRRLSRSIQKISLYFVAILLANGMDQVFFAPKGISFDVTWIVAGLIALTEFKSNLENVTTLTGVNFWTHLSAKLPAILRIPKKGKNE